MPKRKFDPTRTNKDNETRESNNEPNNEQEGSRKSAKQTCNKQAKVPTKKTVQYPDEEPAKNSNNDDEVIEVVASSSQGTKSVKSNIIQSNFDIPILLGQEKIIGKSEYRYTVIY